MSFFAPVTIIGMFVCYFILKLKSKEKHDTTIMGSSHRLSGMLK